MKILSILSDTGTPLPVLVREEEVSLRPLAKVNGDGRVHAFFNPDQPRAPKGTEDGGKWIDTGSSHLERLRERRDLLNRRLKDSTIGDKTEMVSERNALDWLLREADKRPKLLAYNPRQPRAPRGSPIGGEWVGESKLDAVWPGGDDESAQKFWEHHLSRSALDQDLEISHESPGDVASSFLAEGIRGESVFGTLGKASEFVTSPIKTRVWFRVPYHSADMIVPDMRYNPDRPYFDALTRSGGRLRGIDIGFTDAVPASAITKVEVVEDGKSRIIFHRSPSQAHFAFNPDQPRAPVGSEDGGQWVSLDGHGVKEKIASIAQKVYDEWDESCVDEYAGGGICHLIADEIAGELNERGIEAQTVSAEIGEQHVWVVAKTDKGVFNVDIPPGVYERGGGYKWTKIPGVQFNKHDVVVDLLDSNPRNFPQYVGEFAYNPEQPRHPAGDEHGGQWVATGLHDRAPTQEIKEAFDKLAEEQRGTPEFMFHRAQNPGADHAGYIQWSMEHTGDLIHRASNSRLPDYGTMAVREKTEKLLRGVNDLRHHLEPQLKSNWEFAVSRGEKVGSYESFVRMAREASERYADEYEKLQPLTRAQYWGKEAAVALGRWKWDDYEHALRILKAMGDSGQLRKDYYTLERFPRSRRFAFNPNQPRDPKGTKTGGRWTSEGDYIGKYPMSGFRATIPAQLAFDFASQAKQYPPKGPVGISYFKGDVGGGKHVDVLLHRNDKGRVQGILNYYPFDFLPYERKGNVNIFVNPKQQGKGIGTALLKEGGKRFDIDLLKQEYTPAGAKLANRFLRPIQRKGLHKFDFDPAQPRDDHGRWTDGPTDGAIGGESPKLTRDNPHERWENRERQRSLDSGKDQWGAPNTFAALSATFRNEVLIPVDKLAVVPGMRGEQGNVRQNDLNRLIDYMGKYGKLPPGVSSGREYAPFIMVTGEGAPWVNEGNHRIMAAKALGWKYLPVHVSYFAGGENREGTWNPKELLATDAALRNTPRYERKKEFAWEESDHPRRPAGDEHGGEFAPDDQLSKDADAIAAMDEDKRDNTEIGDFPGHAAAYDLYEARKMLPKAVDKLKRVTENNSFHLWQSYDYIANVGGRHFGISKYDDPDSWNEDDEDKTKYVFAYRHLDRPGFKMTETMINTAHPEQLITHLKSHKYAWDESKHPRHPSGDAQGGEFASSTSGKLIAMWEDKFRRFPNGAEDRLSAYLASLVLGRDFGEEADAYYERKGYTEFVRWGREKLGLGKRNFVEERPLYVCRPVLNADQIIAWAKEQGFETALPADEMHVTICYSKQPVDWAAFADWDETKHPRHPAGDERGGEFSPGDVTFKKLVPATDSYGRGSDSTHQAAKHAVFIKGKHLATITSMPTRMYQPRIWSIETSQPAIREIKRIWEGGRKAAEEWAKNNPQKIVEAFEKRNDPRDFAFDPALHPRHPAGTRQGGEFAPQDKLVPSSIEEIAAHKVDPRFSFIVQSHHDEQVEAVRNFLRGEKPLASVTVGDYTTNLMLGGRYIHQKRGFPLPAPAGRWMGFWDPDLAPYVNQADYNKSSAVQKMRFDAMVQLDKYVPEQFHSNYAQFWYPKQYEKWWFDGGSTKNYHIANEYWRQRVNAARVRGYAAWDESKHPRHGAGSPQGGEFAPGHSALLPPEDYSGFARPWEEAHMVLDDGTFVKIGSTAPRNTIKFSKEEMSQMWHRVVTHNHPSGYSLSGTDLALASYAKLKEIRAYGADREGNMWLYQATPGKSGKWPDFMNVKDVFRGIQQDYEAEVASMPGTDLVSLGHAINEEAARKLGHQYQRTLVGKLPGIKGTARTRSHAQEEELGLQPDGSFIIDGEDYMSVSDYAMNDTIEIVGGERKVIPLGADGAVVLRFESNLLRERWQEFKDKGASWDYDDYHPHVTITYQPGGVVLRAVKPYDGPIILGPEEFKEIAPKWADAIEEMANWDESQHPRFKKGDPRGGRFMRGDPGRFARSEEATREHIKKVLTDGGFPEDKIRYQLVKSRSAFESGGVVVGRYSPKSDIIYMNAPALRLLPSRITANTAKYELNHAKFGLASRSREFKKYLSDNMDKLERDDGTTAYARGMWETVGLLGAISSSRKSDAKLYKFGQERAVDESLAEMSMSGKFKGSYQGLQKILEARWRKK